LLLYLLSIATWITIVYNFMDHHLAWLFISNNDKGLFHLYKKIKGRVYRLILQDCKVCKVNRNHTV
jgi:hypothetical protein